MRKRRSIPNIILLVALLVPLAIALAPSALGAQEGAARSKTPVEKVDKAEKTDKADKADKAEKAEKAAEPELTALEARGIDLIRGAAQDHNYLVEGASRLGLRHDPVEQDCTPKR